MKFKAEKHEFVDAVGWVRRLVASRPTMPAHAGMLLELADGRLALSGQDGELGGQLSIPVQAERDGAVLVQARLLADLVTNLPNDAVTGELIDDRLRIQCQRARFELQRMPATEDFHVPPAPAADAPTVTMKTNTFVGLVAQVQPAAAQENTRPHLTGVHIEATPGTLVAAATDSYRLAVRTLGWDEEVDTTALVPQRALAEALRSAREAAEVRIAFEPGRVSFDFGDRRLSTALLEGAFPQFRQLLPAEHDRVLRVERRALVEVIRRVSVMAVESGPTVSPVRLDLSADTVTVSCESPETGQATESLPGQLEGEDLRISFNPRFLQQGLEATGADQVRVECRDETKPVVLRPDDGDDAVDFLYLLMPMQA